MKKYLLILLTTLSLHSFGQYRCRPPLPKNNGIDSAHGITITARCFVSNPKSDPLLIINGELVDYSMIQSLDPNSIASIDILKDKKAGEIFGSPARNGVIVITLKHRDLRLQFVDSTSGEALQDVTVVAIGQKSRPDTIMTISDRSGIANIPLKGFKYNISATSVGFKPIYLKLPDVKDSVAVVKMGRDIKVSGEVVVQAWGHTIRCRTICCGWKVIKHQTLISPDSAISNISVFPNPLKSGNPINIVANNLQTVNEIRIYSLDGKLLLTQIPSTKNVSGIKIITDSRWTPGTYIVQARNQRGDARSVKILIR